MSSEEEDTQALEAADLYSGDATFAEISAKLGVSKSHSQTLVRRGIALFKSVNENSIEEIAELGDPFVPHQGLETNPPQPQAIFPLQDPRTGSYMLETQGISRRVMLTPTDIMVFDLFKNGGFSGDLSDFISDAISFMYNNLRPAERER
ncbi:hypothetical protein ES703_33005 [subsurface metagenome]